MKDLNIRAPQQRGALITWKLYLFSSHLFFVAVYGIYGFHISSNFLNGKITPAGHRRRRLTALRKSLLQCFSIDENKAKKTENVKILK